MVLKDLKEISGLPLKLNGNSLVFGKDMKKVVPEARTKERMNAVLKDKFGRAPKEFYYMYRDVCIESQRKKIANKDLRFDITILPAFVVGEEYNKTFGHYHPQILGQKIQWPEVYEVLNGTAHFILQNKNEVLVFNAKKGDKCVMLPDFAHVTVNPSEKEPLVMANWVCPNFSSDYSFFEKFNGAMWYDTVNGFVKNSAYKKIPNLKLISSKEFPKFGLTKKPMYLEAMKNPKKFEWLSKPWKYSKEFKKYRKA